MSLFFTNFVLEALHSITFSQCQFVGPCHPEETGPVWTCCCCASSSGAAAYTGESAECCKTEQACDHTAAGSAEHPAAVIEAVVGIEQQPPVCSYSLGNHLFLLASGSHPGLERRPLVGTPLWHLNRREKQQQLLHQKLQRLNG